MLDPSTLPKITVKPGTWGDVSIVKNNRYLTLSHKGEEWHVLNIQNLREIHEQWSGYDLAYGDVLISGFGFGHMACWLANKPEVTSVTVVEISQDVLNAFLENNSLPDKVNVVIADINNYQTDKHYDCIILDHISNVIKEQSYYKDLVKVGNNISHDLLWFWSIEMYYLRYHYDILIRYLYLIPISFDTYDFSTKWEELREYLNMKSIPSLSKDKLDSYINSYFLRHLLHKEPRQ